MTISHAELLKIIKSELNIICADKISEDSVIESMKLHELIHDSLDLLDFGMRLENLTGMEIRIDQISNDMKIAELVNMLFNQSNNQPM